MRGCCYCLGRNCLLTLSLQDDVVLGLDSSHGTGKDPKSAYAEASGQPVAAQPLVGGPGIDDMPGEAFCQNECLHVPCLPCILSHLVLLRLHGQSNWHLDGASCCFDQLPFPLN